MNAKAKPKQVAENTAIRDLQAAQQDTDGKLDKIIDVIGVLAEKLERSTAAINTPVVLNKHLESEEQFVGGAGDAEFASIDQAGEQELVQSAEGDVHSPAFKEKMATIAFNAEMLTVQIHTTTEKDADKSFEISINGFAHFFRRGQQYTVRRDVVEGLARAKPVGYGSEEYLDSQGQKQMRYPSERGVRYPFSLVNGTSRDNAWLQHILAQP